MAEIGDLRPIDPKKKYDQIGEPPHEWEILTERGWRNLAGEMYVLAMIERVNV